MKSRLHLPTGDLRAPVRFYFAGRLCCRKIAVPLRPHQRSRHTGKMGIKTFGLAGSNVRLEPLELRHVRGLVAAAAEDPSLYRWSPVPQGEVEAARSVNTAMAGRDAVSTVPFAIVRVSGAPQEEDVLIGSTRFWKLERWGWPEDHARHGRPDPDVCEIGYTWLTRSAIRTAANTEAKLLMLTHAFETWRTLRVCLHTDARNQRSAAAIERIGGKFEGVLRAHRLAADHTARTSMRFSILADEWPDVQRRLTRLMAPA